MFRGSKKLITYNKNLKNRESDDFNFLNFLIKHTLPVPIIEAKDNPNDGVDEYDENGNFSPPQPTPSGPSCKTNAQLAQESQSINAPITKLQQITNFLMLINLGFMK